MKNRNLERSNAIRLQLLFFILLAGTIAGACLLAAYFHAFIHPPAIDPLVLAKRHRFGINPKPEEQFVFLRLGFLVPVIAYCALLASRWSRPLGAPVVRIAGLMLPVLLSIALFAPFIGSDFVSWLDSGHPMPSAHGLRNLICSLLASALWFIWMSVRPRQRKWENLLTTAAAWLVFVVAMLLQLSAWRVVGESSITVDGAWTAHVDAVLYNVSQVVAGKTILVDMPSLYGFFAELVGPIFRVTGLSILHFTVLCALLQIASLSAVVYVTQKVVREPLLKIAFPIALVMITFETVLWFAGAEERYFQYWPIRFFWPALSVLAFYAYRRRPSLGRAAILSLAGGIGSVWNADTGMMIEVAFAAFLVGKWILLAVRFRKEGRSERRHLALALAVQILIFAACAGGMAAYLMIKSGQSLHWQWLFEYQQVFYKIGFGLLPMPMRPDPWMPILGVYLLGLLVSVLSWTTRPKSRTADLVFFLSFLGLGLFVYYEGRSHVLNLISVAWPALMLAVILGDRVIRSVRAGMLPRVYLCLPGVALALVLFCSIPVVRNLKMLWRQTRLEHKRRGKPDDPLAADELAFIRAHSTPGETCLILAKRQGVYYAATGLVSPIHGPGYSELITQRDFEAFVIQLSKLTVKDVFVGTGPDSQVELEFDPLVALKQYSVQAKSTKGSMLYLQPRQ